jgi:hypothetical protein
VPRLNIYRILVLDLHEFSFIDAYSGGRFSFCLIKTFGVLNSNCTERKCVLECVALGVVPIFPPSQSSATMNILVWQSFVRK